MQIFQELSPPNFYMFPCIILFKRPACRSAIGIIVLTIVHVAIILSFMNCTANLSMFKGRSAALAMMPKMLRQTTRDVGHCRLSCAGTH